MSSDRTPHAFRPEDLLAHREWVERAARALVYGDADADDLQQQAWLKVLARPPREEPASPRGWLWSVLRSVAIDRGRAARSRRLHEEEAARPERIDASPAELVARAETLTRVARLALELEEPYRATVLLRYFEDQEPAAIAALQGVPVETVRTRLKRAVAQMRERLDAESGGDRRRWCLALVALLRPSETGPAAGGAGAAAASAAGLLGGALVIKKAAAAIAILVLLLIGGRIALHNVIEFHKTPTAASLAPTTPPAVAAAPSPAKEPATAESGEPAPSAAPAPAAAAATDGAVRVSVRWHDGTPAHGIWVELRAETGRDDPRNSSFARTGEDGTVHFTGIPLGTAWVQLDRFAAGGIRTQVRPGGEPASVELKVAPGFAVEGIVVDRDGRPVAGATIWAGPGGPLGAGLAAAESAGDGTFRLRDRSSPCEVGARAAGHAPSVTAMPTGAPGSVQQVRLVLRGPGAALSGRVVDAEGAPVAGALVQVGPDNHRYEIGETKIEGNQLRGLVVESDAEGRFRVEGIRPGEIPLRAIRAGFARWKGTTTASPGSEAEVEIRLGPGAVLAGSVLNGDGHPVRNAIVTVRDSTGEFHMWAVVAKDGSYRLGDLPAGEFTAEAMSHGLGHVADLLSFEPGVTREWSPRLIPRGTLSVRVVDREGAPLAKWSVYATALDSLSPPEDHYSLEDATDAEGHCVFKDVPDREIQLVLQGPNADRRVQQSVRAMVVRGVRAGAETREIRVPAEFHPSAYITGRVLDAEGKALVSGRIDIAPAGSPPSRGEVHPAPADGAFRIGPIPPGAYSLRVVAPDLPPLPLSVLTVGAGETADAGTVRFERPGALSLRLLTERDLPPTIVRVQLFDAQGLTADTRSLAVQDGRVQFGAVLPGDYSVSVVESAPGVSSGRVQVRVAPGGEPVAEVILRSGRRHVVQVDLPEGDDGVLGARVTVRNADGSVILEEQATASYRREPDGGHTRLPGLRCSVTLPIGTWQVEVLGATGQRGSATAVIAEGEKEPSTTTVAIR